MCLVFQLRVALHSTYRAVATSSSTLRMRLPHIQQYVTAIGRARLEHQSGQAHKDARRHPGCCFGVVFANISKLLCRRTNGSIETGQKGPFTGPRDYPNGAGAKAQTTLVQGQAHVQQQRPLLPLPRSSLATSRQSLLLTHSLWYAATAQQPHSPSLPTAGSQSLITHLYLSSTPNSCRPHSHTAPIRCIHYNTPAYHNIRFSTMKSIVLASALAAASLLVGSASGRPLSKLTLEGTQAYLSQAAGLSTQIHCEVLQAYLSQHRLANGAQIISASSSPRSSSLPILLPTL
jgi:hypothetical protein